MVGLALNFQTAKNKFENIICDLIFSQIAYTECLGPEEVPWTNLLLLLGHRPLSPAKVSIHHQVAQTYCTTVTYADKRL